MEEQIPTTPTGSSEPTPQSPFEGAPQTPSAEPPQTPDGDGDENKPKEPQTVTLDPKTIEAIASSVKPQEQPQEEPKLTQEQLDELLGRFSVSEEDMETLGLPPASLPHFQGLIEKIVQRAVRTNAVMVENIRRQLLQQVQPAITYAQQAQEQQLRQEFFSTYKDLQGADAIVEAVYARLTQQGTDFSKMSRKEAFDLVAQEARKVREQIVQKSGNTPPAGQKPTMLSGGRPGGKSQQTQQAASGSQAAEIFG